MADADEDGPERYQPGLIRTSGALHGFRPVEELHAKYRLNYRLDDLIADINDGYVIRRASVPCCPNLASLPVAASPCGRESCYTTLCPRLAVLHTAHHAVVACACNRCCMCASHDTALRCDRFLPEQCKQTHSHDMLAPSGWKDRALCVTVGLKRR